MTGINIKNEERILFIINNNTIAGSTRFQKYGFLLWKRYNKELKELHQYYENFKFYDDWKACQYGPYSKELDKDFKKCVETKLIIPRSYDRNHYSLTLKGRVRWRELSTTSSKVVKELNNKINIMQKWSLYGLLKSIYKEYPEYAVNSVIKDQLK